MHKWFSAPLKSAQVSFEGHDGHDWHSGDWKTKESLGFGTCLITFDNIAGINSQQHGKHDGDTNPFRFKAEKKQDCCRTTVEKFLHKRTTPSRSRAGTKASLRF